MTKEAPVNTELPTEKVAHYYFSKEIPFSADQSWESSIIQVSNASFLLGFNNLEEIGRMYLRFDSLYSSAIPQVSLVHQTYAQIPEISRTFAWIDTSDIWEDKLPFREWEIFGFSEEIRANLFSRPYWPVKIEDLKDGDQILSIPGVGPSTLRKIDEKVRAFESSVLSLIGGELIV